MQLSEHFTLDELVSSDTAREHGVDNTPSPEVVERLRDLCVDVLEPVRALVGRPVHVNSGYRSPELNKLVGGVPSSQHVLGEAADIEVPGIANIDLAQLIADSGIDYDQLIEEFVLDGDDEAGWVHVSHRAGHNRRQHFSIGAKR